MDFSKILRDLMVLFLFPFVLVYAWMTDGLYPFWDACRVIWLYCEAKVDEFLQPPEPIEEKKGSEG